MDGGNFQRNFIRNFKRIARQRSVKAIIHQKDSQKDFQNDCQKDFPKGISKGLSTIIGFIVRSLKHIEKQVCLHCFRSSMLKQTKVSLCIRSTTFLFVPAHIGDEKFAPPGIEPNLLFQTEMCFPLHHRTELLIEDGGVHQHVHCDECQE